MLFGGWLGTATWAEGKKHLRAVCMNSRPWCPLHSTAPAGLIIQPFNAMQDRDTRERHALAMARIVDPNRWPKGGLQMGVTGRGGCRGGCVLAVQAISLALLEFAGIVRCLLRAH